MKIVPATFPGAAFPPETKVVFETEPGRRQHGTVQRLLHRYASVAAMDGTRWKVPYRLLRVSERGNPDAAPAMTLPQIEALALRLLQKHAQESGLAARWRFGFDLAPARGGICRHSEKLITLSVTYCLKASESEIADTLLHEIAHAIVGPRHGHDAVWKATARKIGCTATRCHTVEHTLPRWKGTCGCDKVWTRQRLTRRSRTGSCGTCGERIAWKRT